MRLLYILDSRSSSGFQIPMRGNEYQVRAADYDLVAQFQIPMRGNERKDVGDFPRLPF